MASTIKVDNVQNQPGTNIVSKCGTDVTIGASGDTVALACGASQTGFGRTGTVDWQTSSIKTATFTAESGKGYFCNTTGGAFEVDLPAGSAGAIVAFKDYAGTWDTNNLEVDPNGSEKIGGGDAGESSILSTESGSVTLVYVDSTQGWSVVNDATQVVIGQSAAYVAATGGTISTVCTNYKVHIFTGPGTFCVSNGGNVKGSNTIDYLVIAGAGSGGSGGGNGGGGGGAGGYIESGGKASGCYSIGLPANACVAALPVTATGYPITVGAGGALVPNSGTGSTTEGNTGSNSIFAGSSTITAAGGGGGAACSPGVGVDGGSGGGAGGGSQNKAGGTGNTPPVSPPQGNDGGTNSPPHSPDLSSMGGGGAGGAGKNNGSDGNPQCYGTNGGIGATSSITATATGYAGGGGGSGYSQPSPGWGNYHDYPNGASPASPVCNSATTGFGGGYGGNWNSPGSGDQGGAGVANKGGGGGGTGYNNTGAGGSGIVILRYKFQ